MGNRKGIWKRIFRFCSDKDIVTSSRGNTHEGFQSKQGHNLDHTPPRLSEMINSDDLHNAPIQSLMGIVNGILDDSIERNNGERVAFMLKKVLREIDHRISKQDEHIKNQENNFKAREEKLQSRIRALETRATLPNDEFQMDGPNHDENKKQDNQDLCQLIKEKEDCDHIIIKLKEEMEMKDKTYNQHCVLLETALAETKMQLEHSKQVLKEKEKENQFLIQKAKKIEEEKDAFSKSNAQHWKKRENIYQSFIDTQLLEIKNLRLTSDFIRREVLSIQSQWRDDCCTLEEKFTELTGVVETYHSVLAENKKMFNELQELKGNIRVYCRVRPFLSCETEKMSVVDSINEDGQLIIANTSQQGKDGRRRFRFNKVFGPAASQEEVYLDTQPVIRSVLDGFNVCIFAYGQTGSGKTYTMSGPNSPSNETWGVNYRALSDLFDISRSRSNNYAYEVNVQMVEIYNEQVRDLLSNDGPQKRLGIRSSLQSDGPVVPDATVYPVSSTSDVLELMHFGLTNRAMSYTALNERSSRSHSILTVHVQGTDLKTGNIFHGCLHLIDLAGSERIDRSEVTGDRLKEAQHINKSLSALGDVISSLSQKSSHVPYRNSKLTHLLQSSLGGRAKTLMFVHLNPDQDSYSETLSTLKFAERVSTVELGVARSNKEGHDTKDLLEEVASLKDLIAKKDEEIELLHVHKGLKEPNIPHGERPSMDDFEHQKETMTLSGAVTDDRNQLPMSSDGRSAKNSRRSSSSGSILIGTEDVHTRSGFDMLEIRKATQPTKSKSSSQISRLPNQRTKTNSTSQKVNELKRTSPSPRKNSATTQATGTTTRTSSRRQ